jgi:cytochrome c biogenesis protein CcdA
MLPGALLAFSFCPATASIFFGVMIPLSVKHGQSILFPILYALGALFPVIAASVVVRRGMGRVLSKRYSRYFSQISGWTLILIGLYITLKEVYL